MIFLSALIFTIFQLLPLPSPSAKLPCLSYPIHSAQIDTIYDRANTSQVYIFAYGSLLNKASATRTLSEETMKTYQPAIAHGYSRTFDRYVPHTKRWGEKKDPRNTGMLNLFKSSESVNGVVFKVGKEELKQLIQREEGYDLVPAIASLWNSNAKPFPVYTFIASEKPREGKLFTNPEIQPVPGYALASQEGAATWGTEFEAYWIHTTYLADRKTPYANWLKEQSSAQDNS